MADPKELAEINRIYKAQIDSLAPNSPSIVHTWMDDLKSTLCGLLEEVVVPPSQSWGAPVHQCPICYGIFVDRMLPLTPTPVEAAFLEVFFPNA